MKTDSFWKGFLAGGAAALLLAAALIYFLNPSLVQCMGSGGLSMEEATSLLGKFNVMKRSLDRQYWEDIDGELHEEMMDAAVHAYASAVGDKYTVYYNPEEFEDFMESVSGSYCGIGVTVSVNEEENLVEVLGVTKGGPCEGTELRVGDFFLEVDGTDVRGATLDDTVALVRGQEGTSVTILFRHADGEEFLLTVVRRIINAETVSWQLVEEAGAHKVAHLTITEFDEVTEAQFEKALKELTEAGAEALILDVRDNPGGLLDTVTAMLDRLLPEGILTWTEDKYGNKETFRSDAACFALPMAVLCNGNSASASEIFCGALKDYEAAVLVGETTFGKGIVQRTAVFPDGSAMKMTVSRYFTPAGHYIHGVGVEPDVRVALPEGVRYSSELSFEEDTQLQAALEEILKMLP